MTRHRRRPICVEGDGCRRTSEKFRRWYSHGCWRPPPVISDGSSDVADVYRRCAGRAGCRRTVRRITPDIEVSPEPMKAAGGSRRQMPDATTTHPPSCRLPTVPASVSAPTTRRTVAAASRSSKACTVTCRRNFRVCRSLSVAAPAADCERSRRWRCRWPMGRVDATPGGEAPGPADARFSVVGVDRLPDFEDGSVVGGVRWFFTEVAGNRSPHHLSGTPIPITRICRSDAASRRSLLLIHGGQGDENVQPSRKAEAGGQVPG